MPIKVKVDGTWRIVADAKPPKPGQSFAGGIYLGKFDDDYYLIAAEHKYHVHNLSGSGNFFNKGLMRWCESDAYKDTGATDSDDGLYNYQMLNTFMSNNTFGLTDSDFPVHNYVKNFMNSGTGANGYKDWYLPSYEELLFILLNSRWFPRYTNLPFSFLDTSVGYWSSTEYSSTIAYDSPYHSKLFKHRKYWFRYGYYYEYYNKYWGYGGYSYNNGITSYKNKLQGIIPVRRVDI